MKGDRKLTRPQRWALFAVGAFGKLNNLGACKPRVQGRVLQKLNQFIEFDVMSLTRNYCLTEAGKGLFAELFGAPCPEHGWRIVVRAFDRDYRRCETCRAVFQQVEGHEAPPRILASDSLKRGE